MRFIAALLVLGFVSYNVSAKPFISEKNVTPGINSLLKGSVNSLEVKENHKAEHEINENDINADNEIKADVKDFNEEKEAEEKDDVEEDEEDCYIDDEEEDDDNADDEDEDGNADNADDEDENDYAEDEETDDDDDKADDDIDEEQQFKERYGLTDDEMKFFKDLFKDFMTTGIL